MGLRYDVLMKPVAIVPPLLPLLPVLALAALASAPACSPTVPRRVIENTEVRPLPPSANGRGYLVYVALPDSYADHPDKRYPVLYLCDGYWDFNLVKGFYGNLVYDQVVPEFILVAFGYQGDKPDYERLRRWDLTPAADKADGAGSGHADAFLAVVEQEAIPFVQRTYRVDAAYRVLGGSSLGGLFALYALFTKPGLFQAYIAPSPAVDWADDWLFGYEDAFKKSGQKLQTRLYMTGAERERPEFLAAIKRFDTRLREHAYELLSYQFRLVDGERHAGTKAESYNRGVRFAFEPMSPLKGRPAQ
jgi:predicted alpha/beta superfamily hydrolase